MGDIRIRALKCPSGKYDLLIMCSVTMCIGFWLAVGGS